MNENDDPQPIPSETEIEGRFDAIKAKLDPLTQNPELDAKVSEFLDRHAETSNSFSDSVHPELDDKLASMQQRLDSAKSTYEQTKPKANSVSGGLDQKTSLGMGLGLSMAYTIIGAPLVGYGLGLLLNKLTGNPGWHIWTTLIFSIIAIGWVAMIGSKTNDRL